MKNFRLTSSTDKRTTTIKKNIIGSFLIKGCSIIISLMLVPITLGYVSSELYGIWLTLSSIMMWISFFDIGFTLGLKNKLTEAITLNQWEKGKSLVSTTYFIMILIFIPLCILLIIAIPYIDWASFLNINKIYNHDIIKTLYVLVACFCLQMIVNIISTVVSAYQKVALSASFPVIGNALSLIVIYLLTQLCPPSLFNLAIAISIMPIIVMFFFSIFLFRHRFRRVSPNIKYIKSTYIKDLFNLGLKFFIIQIQIVILYQCTNILISKVSGPDEVTAYNIAYKYLGIAMMAYTIMLSPLWPAFTDAYTKQDFKWMKNTYKKMSKVCILLILALICMIFGSSFIYQLWIGDKANIPFIMTLIVGVYMMIHSWNSLQVQLINGIGAIKLQSYITLIGIILHIPLSFLLGRYIGAIGVLCSMIIINIIYSCFFTIQIRKILNQKAIGIWLK